MPEPAEVRNRFMRWLYQHNDLQPNPQDFCQTDQAVIDGHRVAEDELVSAVRILDAKPGSTEVEGGGGGVDMGKVPSELG